MVLRLVEKSSPKGRMMGNACRRLLMHEKSWLKWKANSCSDFEKTVEPEDELFPQPLDESFPLYSTMPSEDGLDDGVDDDALLSGVDLGSREMSRLWKSGKLYQDYLVTLQEDESVKVPSLKDFLEPLIDQMNPEHDIEKAYRISSNPTYVWKCIRLAMSSQLELLKTIGHADIECLPLLPLAKKVPDTGMEGIFDNIDYSGYSKDAVVMLENGNNSDVSYKDTMIISPDGRLSAAEKTATAIVSDLLQSAVEGKSENGVHDGGEGADDKMEIAT
jgi:hypothetical protein